MQKILFCVVISCSGILLKAEKDPAGNSKTYTVYVNYPDYSVRAVVLSGETKVHPKEGYVYYWYSGNAIKSTEGGFDGKLLHGEYASFYLDKSLKEKGEFSRGLKTGTWKTWFPDGKLHEVTRYKNGMRNGIAEQYDEQGHCISKTTYRNDRRNGKTVLSVNGKDSVIHYKDDQPLPAKTGKMKHSEKHKKQKAEKGLSDSCEVAQDTIAGSPKSSFNLKKVFSRREKDLREKEPKEKTKTEDDKNQSDKQSKKPGVIRSRSKQPLLKKRKKKNDVVPSPAKN